MAQILDGRKIAAEIKEKIKSQVDGLSQATKPCIGILISTTDESAASYVNSIKKAAESVGILVNLADASESFSTEKFWDRLNELREDPAVNGIIIQTPVAADIDLEKARRLIPVEKDIDGANPLSSGKLFNGQERFVPATATAVIEIIKSYQIETAGKHAVIVGRSSIVGKPVAHLLLALNSTVTICHSATVNLASFTKSGDIIVAAAGKIGLISSNHVNPDCVVIDVGTNFNQSGEMVGDVDFESVEKVVKAITPVPGGVGPVTTAILLRNTLEAYSKQNS